MVLIATKTLALGGAHTLDRAGATVASRPGAAPIARDGVADADPNGGATLLASRPATAPVLAGLRGAALPPVLGRGARRQGAEVVAVQGPVLPGPVGRLHGRALVGATRVARVVPGPVRAGNVPSILTMAASCVVEAGGLPTAASRRARVAWRLHCAKVKFPRKVPGKKHSHHGAAHPCASIKRETVGHRDGLLE